jgi:hypothetical protein
MQTVLLDPDTLDAMRALAAKGVSMRTYDTAHVLLHRDAVPGLARSMIVNLSFPEGTFALRTTYNRGGNEFALDDASYLAPDWFRLDEADQQAVTEWGTNLVKATRLAAMVKSTVAEVLKNCDTVGHVLAWWPALATMVTESAWKARFRNPPRSLRAYGPPARLAAIYAQLIQASSVVLSSAELLGEYHPATGTIQATLVRFEHIPNDRKF